MIIVIKGLQLQMTDATPSESLTGNIERITFHSEETGFCVLRIKVTGVRKTVALVGKAMCVHEGEYIKAVGQWKLNKKHGQQFQAEELTIVPPNTMEGIKKYLASGLIKGIGEHFANKLVKAFGVEVFEVIENHPQRLKKLPGIGKKRTEQILKSFKEQKAIRNIMVFLQSYGVGTGRAVRIYKTYGDSAIEKVKENPYRLSQDVYGIGFKLADELAQRLGIPKEALIRAQAGVRYVLQKFSAEGHCGVRYKNLIHQANKLLDIPGDIIAKAIQSEIQEKRLAEDTMDEEKCIFLMSLYYAEKDIANQLKKLQLGELPWGNVASDKAIPWVETKTKLRLSESQRKAIETVLKNKVSIITGGPGVGKTTIVNSILKIVKAKGMSVSLCAPTGRAAKRLSETTGFGAKTIHRLLEYSPQEHAFKCNGFNPLNIDFLVIDETSMLDIPLMFYLIKAIPDHAACLFVGDVDQLPSVGPGSFLKDCIDSKKIACVFLTEIFRQASDSNIIINAHRINEGEMPIVSTHEKSTSDFYLIEEEDPEEIQKKLIHVVTSRIPKRFGFNPIDDIQVLTPMHRSGLGAQALNIALQEKLNGKAEPKIQRFGYTFAPGDKVIQNVNDYDKEVFNGDIGVIRSIDLQEQLLQIKFDDRLVPYEFSDLDKISLAYAISIHKSQGSEYPAVVIPLATQHYIMLARNLLYTGVTRGKKLVILMGQAKAIKIAVKNAKSKHRLTKLKEWLSNE